ncbi:Uncharacterised protein [Mycobacterium tuberculosis]|uniref:Uncharacterized protein n=1 Tax=Mycobacterium tuberculosis TaxID=1773 RepID=A0A654TIG1_MYCTX|nr:Uncharacterised protein [Mycobacterium tuberculosis]CFS31672.1 Uncharacterised protein [Mycobacterium tuberculosis]CKR11561.1 Uncharacterised protein [Mycobacterium tuberculosis]CKR66784.1 Uncharacterised protein [Mycobacterium tuberculosis]CKS12113.1 Uncharacterised protein [Mycobacterium tuberculosis]
MRNGSPAVQSRRCSATGSGPSEIRGRSRSSAIVRARSARWCSRASAAATTVSRESATRSVSRSNSVSVSNWASSMTSAVSGGSPSGGGHASTVSPERRSVSRAAARTVVLPVPMPPVIRTLTGTVGAFASSRRARRAAGGTSVRESVTDASYAWPRFLHPLCCTAGRRRLPHHSPSPSRSPAFPLMRPSPNGAPGPAGSAPNTDAASTDSIVLTRD